MALTAKDVRLRIPLTPEAMERLSPRPGFRNRAMKAQPVILAPSGKELYRFKIWYDVSPIIKEIVLGVIQDWNDLLGKEVLVPAKDGEFVDLAIGAKPFYFSQPQFESAPIGALLPHNTKPYSEPQDEYGECVLHWNDSFVRQVGQINVATGLSEFDTKCAFSHELGHFFLLGHAKETYRLMHHSMNGVGVPKPKEIEWVREINGFNW